MKKSGDLVTNVCELVEYSGKEYENSILASIEKVNKSERKKTYLDLQNDVGSICKYFQDRKLKGKQIGIMGKQNYQWLEFFLAIMCSGNVVVPLDGTDVDLEKKVSQLDLYEIFVDKTVAKSGIVSDAIFMEKIDRKAQCCKFEHIAPESEAIIVFTSGTTGDYKAVILTHQNIISNVKCGAFFIDGLLKRNDHTVPILPTTHMLELTVGLLTAVYEGATLCFGRGVKYFSRDIQYFKPRVLVLVPLIVENLYDKIIFNVTKKISEKKFRNLIKFSNALRKIGIDLRRVLFKDIISQLGGDLETVVCGGAKMREDVVRGFDDIGIKILEGYGITECSPIISCNRKKQRRFHTVGVKGPTEFCEVKIMDGEICVRGKIVFKEYYNNRKATEEAMQDGWFHTGDLGEIDADNYLKITGRKKDLIILGDGNNVSPDEIEKNFVQIPFIKSMFVYEKRNGVQTFISAAIYPDYEYEFEGGDIKKKIEENIKIVNQKLPAYKRIQSIEYYEEDFEKTSLGKIKKFKYIG